METTTITTAFETAMEALKTDVLGMAVIAVPIALSIFAIVFAIRKAKTVFKAAA